MNYDILISVAIVVAGWFVAHMFEKNRDRLAKRRELRVQFLLEAYRNLESSSNRFRNPETQSKIESAIADIQLFGTASEVSLAQKFANDIAQNGDASLDSLLEELRQGLRSELLLEEVPAPLMYLRFS